LNCTRIYKIVLYLYNSKQSSPRNQRPAAISALARSGRDQRPRVIRRATCSAAVLLRLRSSLADVLLRARSYFAGVLLRVCSSLTGVVLRVRSSLAGAVYAPPLPASTGPSPAPLHRCRPQPRAGAPSPVGALCPASCTCST
jgi:hypothetical protein